MGGTLLLMADCAKREEKEGMPDRQRMNTRHTRANILITLSNQSGVVSRV